jgi:hypothetical protein
MLSKLRIGSRTCFCRSCERYFGSVAGFDLHRRDGACLDPFQIKTKKGAEKLVFNARGIWVAPMSEKRRNQIAAMGAA